MGTALHGVVPKDALADQPGDPPDGWVVPGVWEWWSSLLARLQSGGFGTVRLMVDQPRVLGFGQTQVLEPDSALLREWVAREAGIPSSAGLFTLAWGVKEQSGRVAQGAAFSVADHLGLCLCALPDDLAGLKAWWESTEAT